MLSAVIVFSVAALCAAAPTPAPSGSAQQVDLFMPDVQVKQDDAYMCVPLKLSEDKAVYITGFEPKADMSVSHHILLYGCEEAGDESGKPFSCTQMDHASDDAKPTCAKGSAIIYAWAMGAPSFELPKDVAFKVGKDTKLKTLVLQMHFKFNGTYKGGSGLKMKVQDKPTSNVAGIYLMATGGMLPAQSKTYLETACEYSLPAVFKPFAYRAHTHTNGLVVAGYRVRDNRWTEIGRKNPQLPQMFYPLTNPAIDIREGDILAARCTMVNTEERDIMIGATKNDEMCNFYIMYSVPNTPKALEAMKNADGCFSDGTPYTRTEWQRDFGLSNGFPPQSTAVPAGDVELAKTMGDHMQMGNMNMNMNMDMDKQMPSEMQVNDEVDSEDNELENEAFYRALLADSEEDADADDEEDENENENEEDDNGDRMAYANLLADSMASNNSE